MKSYLLIAIFATSVFLGSVQTASACSCLAPEPGLSLKKQVQSAIAAATSVHMADVLGIRYSDETVNGVPVKMYATLAVKRSWKGSRAAIIEVETANICCICGFNFEVGKTYIIYSNSPNSGTISVSSCSRTAQVTGKSPDEKYLGKARKPKKS